MSKHIHIHLGTRDSFDEGKHPRANNGQFGAGEGKFHSDHAAHHAVQADVEAKKGNKEASEAHSHAYNMHESVAGPVSAKAAHEASRVAHEKSKSGEVVKEVKSDVGHQTGGSLLHADKKKHKEQAEHYREKLKHLTKTKPKVGDPRLGTHTIAMKKAQQLAELHAKASI